MKIFLNSAHYQTQLKPFFIGLILFLCFAFLPREYLPQLALHEKLQHVIAFAGLTLLVVHKKIRPFSYLCLLLLLLGGLIELIQPLVQRSAEWEDILANFLGVAIVYLPTLVLKSIFKIAPPKRF
ncbi:hypothetical protein CBF23_013240 [Marinomonas agarivorans]|nr:hypothetical protein CBF23_013240 [Marinomonas agarivorans]